MMDWNEDNFLERLGPQLRGEGAAQRGHCPDAATLCAVMEGEAQDTVRTTVAKHVAQCPACANLERRLTDFDQAAPPEPEAAWRETRNRLDHWLEMFLRSEAADLRGTQPAKPLGGALSWQSVSSRFSHWKIEGALGVAVVMVFIAGAVLLKDTQRKHYPSVEVAARPPARQEQQPIAAPAEEANKQGAPPSPAAPGDHTQPIQAAQGNTPSIMNSDVAPYPKSSKTVVAPSAHPGTITSEPHPSATPASPRVAPAAPADHLPSLRLEPGARLFTVVRSIHHQPDGSFEFEGVLILPLAQPGLVTLDRGTEVKGVGTVSHGHTSLAVTELGVQGARYTLKDGDGTMNAQTPGTDGEVHFDRSQALEMWSAFVATYEPVSDQPAPPAAPK